MSEESVSSTSLPFVLDLLRHDLEATIGYRLSVLPRPAVFDQDVDSVWLVGRARSRTGVLATTGLSTVELILQVAEHVQDFVQEEMAVVSGSNWPECPIHPGTHPAQPKDVGGVATWTCPRVGASIAPIGTLQRVPVEGNRASPEPGR